MVLISTNPDNARLAPDGAHMRLGELFDHGTVRPVATLSGQGIVVAGGEVQGTPTLAFATEPGRNGGAIGITECVRIAEAVAAARRGKRPIVGIWPSGGVGLTDGVAALAGIGPMFAAIRGASGRIPQISVVLGPAASGAAYVPAMTDVIVETAFGRCGVALDDPGGRDGRSRQSERADVVVGNGSAAVAVARSLVDLLGRPGRPGRPDQPNRPGRPEPDGGPGADLGRRAAREFGRASGVRPVVDALLDGPGIELHPEWASNLVTVLGRFGGRTIGVVASESGRPGSPVDSAAAEKARRFGRLCDAFGLPLVMVVDREGSDGPGSGAGSVSADAPARRRRPAEHRDRGCRRVAEGAFAILAQRSDIDDRSARDIPL